MALANPDISPVFVVGSARAGTSALVAALRDGASIPCDNEGHLISILHPVIKAAREHIDSIKADRTTLARVGGEVIDELLIEAIRKAQESAFPSVSRWLDKSPDGPMLRAIPYIVRMWPNAKFIFAKRRAIENVVSRSKKFPHLSFRENCERWVIAMNQWEARRETIAESNRIELEQRDMALDPAGSAQKLAAFLNLSPEVAAVVEHTFATARPESTGGDERVETSIDTVGWSRQQKDVYREICGHVAAKWGYSDGPEYYL